MKTSNVVVLCIWSPIIGLVIGALIGFVIAKHFGFDGYDLKAIAVMGGILLCSGICCFFIRPGVIEGLLTEVK